MKTILILLLISTIKLSSQQTNFPGFNLVNLDGVQISSTDLLKSGQPTVIVFWKAGHTKCCDNLENMNAVWNDQLKDKNIRFIAVCVDYNGNWSKIKPYVHGKDWDFDVYIDINGDCHRAMEISALPYTILLDQNQKLVGAYAGYCSGNEELMCNKILHLLDAGNDALISEK